MLAFHTRPSSRARRGPGLSVATLVLGALVLACSEELSGPDPSERETGLTAKPVSCPSGTSVPANRFNQLPLRITLRSDPGDALRTDGGGEDGSYKEGVDGGVHISGNGNLMLWVGDDSGRHVKVTTTASDGITTDRIYTNSHDNPGGNDACGLYGMVNGSTGSAVFEVELTANSVGNGIVRYGKTCDGVALPEADPSRVVTTRSADGNSWTITGTSGVHCRKDPNGKRNAPLIEVGTAGPFSMTLKAEAL